MTKAQESRPHDQKDRVCRNYRAVCRLFLRSWDRVAWSQSRARIPRQLFRRRARGSEKAGSGVKVKMFEGSGKMGFEPARIEVRRGEQVRFVLRNNGEEDHEFVLATVPENRKHAEVMKTHSDMGHDDPNAKRVLPYGNADLIWKFTKRGEFEFACLIPGHYEKGMFGKVIVK
jgi:uncharacterized cupredoxin-like copper-binding protein